MKTKIFKLIVKYFNLKQFLKDMVNEVLDEALEKVVQSTATPFDNAAKAALYPEVEKALGEIIEEKVNVEKWLGVEEASK
jgi:hypothetical protein